MRRKYASPLVITVPRSVREALIARAQQENTTVASLVKLAIQEYLARLSLPQVIPPPGNEDITVRLSEETRQALARQALAPRHTLSAVSRLAIADVLGIQAQPGEPLARVSTRLPDETLDKLHDAADAYTREAIIQRALLAYRQGELA